MTDPKPGTPRKLDLSLLGPEHVRRYRETNGEVGYLWNGAPCLVLTTRGRRSGVERDVPLIFGADGRNCVVVASKGGAPQHPRWYENLVSDPHVKVQVRGDRFDAIARSATGAERARLWKIATAVWPSYDEYVKRTTREIPVVLLERV